jgi:flagellar L-ring protein precursor FlgH
VTPQNTVLSTQIADAQISYSGSGAVAESNQAGWLARFFNSAFWPF